MKDQYQLRQSAEMDLAHDPFTLACRRVTPNRRVTPTLRLVESRRVTETRRTMVARPESVPRRLTAARRTTAARRLTDRRTLDAHSADVILHELQVHQIELEMQNEQLRASQQELEQARERYVDFYDFAPVGYLTLNDRGMISEINLTGAAMIGVERHALHNLQLLPVHQSGMPRPAASSPAARHGLGQDTNLRAAVIPS